MNISCVLRMPSGGVKSLSDTGGGDCSAPEVRPGQHPVQAAAGFSPLTRF